MGGAGVIDRFLEVFTRYIDSGFGLLGGEVAFIATTLIVIDMTMAALFWSWGAGADLGGHLLCCLGLDLRLVLRDKAGLISDCQPAIRSCIMPRHAELQRSSNRTAPVSTGSTKKI